jgi:hypothetical protein
LGYILSFFYSLLFLFFREVGSTHPRTCVHFSLSVYFLEMWALLALEHLFIFHLFSLGR